MAHGRSVPQRAVARVYPKPAVSPAISSTCRTSTRPIRDIPDRSPFNAAPHTLVEPTGMVRPRGQPRDSRNSRGILVNHSVARREDRPISSLALRQHPQEDTVYCTTRGKQDDRHNRPTHSRTVGAKGETLACVQRPPKPNHNPHRPPATFPWSRSFSSWTVCTSSSPGCSWPTLSLDLR